MEVVTSVGGAPLILNQNAPKPEPTPAPRPAGSELKKVCAQQGMQMQAQLFKTSELKTYSDLSQSEYQSPVLSRSEMSIREAFGSLEENTEYPYATGADWSTIDMIEHFLSIVGPSHLVGCTWSVSEAAAIKIAMLQDAGKILSTKFLVDWRVQVRTPSFLKVAKAKFADVRVSSCHAKAFVLIPVSGFKVSCVGSANFTSNPRIEAGHVSTTGKICEFHAKWISDEINNAQPFGCDMRKKGKQDGRK
jgi:hypothetical protein